jgi:ABC-2 type transport system permease protein
MTGAARLFASYAAASVRSQMQYRASFLMGTLGSFLNSAMEMVAVAALFSRFGTIQGWTLPEIALLYGVVNMAFAIAESTARGFDIFGYGFIQRGDFDWHLLRPRHTALQVAGIEVRLRYFGRFLQGALALGWGISRLGLAWTAPKTALLAAAILGGACLFSGILVLQATLAFWTVQSLEMMNTVTYGGVETANYPLGVYRGWFRKFFTFVVPLACVNYYPVLAIMERTGREGVPASVPWLAPLVGPLFLLASLRVWEFGVRRYCSTGS